MTAIGYVTKLPDNKGYKGSLLHAPIEIVPNPRKTTCEHPDFIVMSHGFELGEGWLRQSETGEEEHVSMWLSLAAPELGAHRLYANLGRAAVDDDDAYAIIWNPRDNVAALEPEPDRARVSARFPRAAKTLYVCDPRDLGSAD